MADLKAINKKVRIYETNLGVCTDNLATIERIDLLRCRWCNLYASYDTVKQVNRYLRQQKKINNPVKYFIWYCESCYLKRN